MSDSSLPPATLPNLGTPLPAALVSIGTELTRGELVNRNATWLADRLVALGHEVTEIVTVDDDDERIVSTLRRLATTHSILVCTGGLGPTTDDRTTACVAALLDVELERDEHSAKRIRTFFERLGRQPAACNLRQADFPVGATILDNDWGTAPGFSVDILTEGHTCRAFFLPGVPVEMEGIYDTSVVLQLPSPINPVSARRLRTFGIPESEVNERLFGIEDQHRVTLGYRASDSEIEVKILNPAQPGEPLAATEERTSAVVSTIRQRLGGAVYGEGRARLAEHLGRILLERGLTLGLAESCTGGLVSQMITSVPGASAYYLGGVCSYSNDVKASVLGVKVDALDEYGAVSREVARQMALGARRLLSVDVALSLTGIAGPGGSTVDKPVGLVHWAVSIGDLLISNESVFRGTREQVTKRAALAGLWSLRQALLDAA